MKLSSGNFVIANQYYVFSKDQRKNFRNIERFKKYFTDAEIPCENINNEILYPLSVLDKDNKNLNFIFNYFIPNLFQIVAKSSRAELTNNLITNNLMGRKEDDNIKKLNKLSFENLIIIEPLIALFNNNQSKNKNSKDIIGITFYEKEKNILVKEFSKSFNDYKLFTRTIYDDDTKIITRNLFIINDTINDLKILSQILKDDWENNSERQKFYFDILML